MRSRREKPRTADGGEGIKSGIHSEPKGRKAVWGQEPWTGGLDFEWGWKSKVFFFFFLVSVENAPVSQALS